MGALFAVQLTGRVGARAAGAAAAALGEAGVHGAEEGEEGGETGADDAEFGFEADPDGGVDDGPCRGWGVSK